MFKQCYFCCFCRRSQLVTALSLSLWIWVHTAQCHASVWQSSSPAEAWLPFTHMPHLPSWLHCPSQLSAHAQQPNTWQPVNTPVWDSLKLAPIIDIQMYQRSSSYTIAHEVSQILICMQYCTVNKYIHPTIILRSCLSSATSAVSAGDGLPQLRCVTLMWLVAISSVISVLWCGCVVL